jgi:hypothetical protein
MPQLYQARVEFEARYRGHMDVSDKAGCLVETGRCQKIGCRREYLDSVTKGLHEHPHGFAKKFIIFDNRDQWRFGQAGLRHSREATSNTGASYTLRQHAKPAGCAQQTAVASAEPLNFWLMR